MTRFFLIITTFLFLIRPSLADIYPSEIMSDPVQQSRAAHLYTQLRCVVCESQSIADSNSEMAAALRAAVREKISAGANDQQILSYVREKYGDKALMRPPVRAGTIFLWAFPFIVLGAGLLLILKTFTRERGVA